MFIRLFTVLVFVHGSSVICAESHHNFSDLSYSSNGIGIPVPPGGQKHKPNRHSAVDEMQLFSKLFDQHQWLDRLGVLDNEECKENMEIYIEQLRNGSLWAAKMYDASGRYNGLFFFGNDYWLGSSQLCQELQNEDTNTETPPFSSYFYVAKVLININPRLTPVTRQINLGLCLPKSCSSADVRALLTKDGNEDVSVTIVDVRPVPGNYSLLQDFKLQIIGISGLITLLLIIVASIVEVILRKKYNKPCRNDSDVEVHDPVEHSRSKETIINKDEKAKRKKNIFLRLLLAFSAITNGRKILSVNTVSKDVIGCLHGLRVFSIGWIILVHTYLEVFGVSRNKSLRIITERDFMYQTISNATFSVDTFFFISGLLVTLGFFRNEHAKIKNGVQESLAKIVRASFLKYVLMLTYRFIRLTPAYLFVLGVNEVIMRYVHSNSVFTPGFIDHITCDKYWWRNALYINNFFPQAEFCMLWSWYIANDTQFFVIASLLLIIAVRGGTQLKYVGVSIAVLLVSSWVVTFTLAMHYHYVARVQEPFALFDELYDKPWMRIGPYLIGMGIGYMLYKLNGQIMFTPAVVVTGWTLSLTCLGSLVYGMGKHGLFIPTSAFYVALGHTAWGLALAWITVACCSGYGGPFNALFSCRLFLPLSRLTYGAYLVHPVLMCITSFVLDGSLQIHNLITVVIFFGNVVLSFVCAFIISLGFEAPAINLLKIILS